VGKNLCILYEIANVQRQLCAMNEAKLLLHRHATKLFQYDDIKEKISLSKLGKFNGENDERKRH
jgi:hypothetical protein